MRDCSSNRLAQGASDSVIDWMLGIKQLDGFGRYRQIKPTTALNTAVVNAYAGQSCWDRWGVKTAAVHAPHQRASLASWGVCLCVRTYDNLREVATLSGSGLLVDCLPQEKVPSTR